MNVTITDNITGATATCAHFEVADTITAWYPDAPADVTQAIADLEAGLTRGEYVGELAVFLDLTVTR